MLVSNAMVASATLITNYDNTNTVYAAGIGTWATNSNLMIGMTVNVTFADNSTGLSGVWGSGVNGGASSTSGSDSFQLYTTDAPDGSANSTGSTYFGVGFKLVNNGTSNITSVTINGFDGTTGSTVFDIESNPNSPYSTANSLEGAPLADSWDYWDSSLNSGAGDYKPWSGTVSFTSSSTMTATYFNQVALTGSVPVGDLYGGLRWDFDGNGFTKDDSFWGIADTDNVNFNPVPEPSTMILFGLGMCGIFGRFGNKKKKMVS